MNEIIYCRLPMQDLLEGAHPKLCQGGQCQDCLIHKQIKEKILVMEAGRELDKVVGEIVFGYEVKIFQGFAPDLCYQYRTPSEYGETYEFLPNYSTDISAAWQVVERMSQLGLTMSLLLLSYELYPEPYWYCDFRLKGKQPPEYEWVDHQKTAPEAIVKAALLEKYGTKTTPT